MSSFFEASVSRNLTALDLADHARTETAEVMAIGSSTVEWDRDETHEEAMS